jgi:hypothetical protein
MYKYFMKIEPTHTLLYKQKLVNSNLCDLCSMTNKTLEHLFRECPKAANFCGQVGIFLHSKYEQINLDT